MIRTLPLEGCDHPVFSAMEKTDGVEIFYCYRRDEQRAPPPNDALQAWHDKLVLAVEALCGRDCGPIAYWNSSATRFVLTHVDNPAAVLRTICDRAGDYPIPVNQVVMRRGTMTASGFLGDIVPDPRAPRPVRGAPKSDDELWEVIFKDAQPPFPSVAENIGFMTARDSAGGVITEMRLPDPVYPDVRLLGYLGSIEPVAPREDDERASELAAAVREAIARHWPDGVTLPTLINRQGTAFQHVDRIVWRGRTGFAFAIKRDGEAILQPLVDTIRSRENEILDATRDVVVSQGLLPVFNWERSRNVYIVNLWEKD